MEDKTKVCSLCKEELPATLDYFTLNQDRLRSRCKICHNTMRTLYRFKNKDKVNRRERRRKTTYSRYTAMIYTIYRLREEDVVFLMDNQKGCCAICGKSLVNPIWSKSDMHIDHCHTTGNVRGLLCGKCNWLLGVAKEDPSVLESAVQYVKERC